MKKIKDKTMGLLASLLIVVGVILLMAECEGLGLLVMTKIASIPFFYVGATIIKKCEV